MHAFGSRSAMAAAVLPLPDDVEALKALVLSMGAELAAAKAQASATEALIAHLKLQIARLKREQYGPSAERSRRLLDQFELQLEDLEATASEDELAAEQAAVKTTNVAAFFRKRPARKPFPCRASAWSSRRRARVRPAAAPGCRGSART